MKTENRPRSCAALIFLVVKMSDSEQRLPYLVQLMPCALKTMGGRFSSFIGVQVKVDFSSLAFLLSFQSNKN